MTWSSLPTYTWPETTWAANTHSHLDAGCRIRVHKLDGETGVTQRGVQLRIGQQLCALVCAAATLGGWCGCPGSCLPETPRCLDTAKDTEEQGNSCKAPVCAAAGPALTPGATSWAAAWAALAPACPCFPYPSGTPAWHRLVPVSDQGRTGLRKCLPEKGQPCRQADDEPTSGARTRVQPDKLA